MRNRTTGGKHGASWATLTHTEVEEYRTDYWLRWMSLDANRRVSHPRRIKQWQFFTPCLRLEPIGRLMGFHDYASNVIGRNGTIRRRSGWSDCARTAEHFPCSQGHPTRTDVGRENGLCSKILMQNKIQTTKTRTKWSRSGSATVYSTWLVVTDDQSICIR